MKPRRNTSDPELGSSHTNTTPSTTKPNTLKKSIGNSLEMNSWSRRYAPLQSNAPDMPSAAQLQPLELRPQSQIYSHTHSQSQPQTPLSPNSQYYQQYLQNQSQNQSQPPPPPNRTSTTSSHDGIGNGQRTSRRGSSRNSRPILTPTPPHNVPVVDFATDFSTDFDGHDMFYPLSPAPVKKSETAKGARMTLGDDSEILPPDDRNYPVPPFRIASSSTLASQRNSTGAGLNSKSKNGQSGVTVPPPTAVPLRIIHTSPTGPPSIYWSDDNASQAGTDSATIRTTVTATNPSAFTFYREDPDDDSDGDADLDPETRRQNRASRRLSRLSRLSRITSSTVAHERTDTEKRRSTAQGNGKMGDKNADTNADKEKEAVKADPCDLDNLSDDDLEDSIDVDGRRLEGRQTAEFEFVNGRYVPPALRNGRAPGRKPVNESRELARELERKRKLNIRGALGATPTTSSSNHVPEPSLGGDHDEERDVYYEDRGRGAPSFWFVAGVIVFFIVAIAVGVGVGVGLSMSR